MENRRRHFRLAYPLKERPAFVVAGASFSIVDLSEGGLRIRLPAGAEPLFVPEEAVEGTVHFSDGSSRSVAGRVVRVAANEAALELSRGVPATKVAGEQRRIMQRYRT